MKNTVLRVLALALFTVLVAGSASAYVLLDPPRTWDCPPNIIVDDRGQSSITDSDGGVSATVNAITSNQAWNGAVNGVLTAQAGSMSGYTLGDGVPMLNFQDPVNACKGNCLAATFIGYYEQRSDGTYRIFDADIVTNGRFSWTTESEPDGCSSEFYMEGVQVHEVGHVLGLGHTDVTGATMYPSVSSCDNGPATTEADDEAGLQDLYDGSFPYCGGEPPPPGGCDLLPSGASCTENSECCSGNCKGKPGSRTCK